MAFVYIMFPDRGRFKVSKVSHDNFAKSHPAGSGNPLHFRAPRHTTRRGCLRRSSRVRVARLSSVPEAPRSFACLASTDFRDFKASPDGYTVYIRAMLSRLMAAPARIAARTGSATEWSRLAAMVAPGEWLYRDAHYL